MDVPIYRAMVVRLPPVSLFVLGYRGMAISDQRFSCCAGTRNRFPSYIFASLPRHGQTAARPFPIIGNSEVPPVHGNATGVAEAGLLSGPARTRDKLSPADEASAGFTLPNIGAPGLRFRQPLDDDLVELANRCESGLLATTPN